MSRILRTSILLLTAFVLSLILSSCSDENPVDPAILPKITSFWPERGHTGTQLSISGEGFKIDSNTKVYIGNVQARITGGDHRQITIEVPQGAVSGPIKVCTDKGCSETARVFEVITFRYYDSATVEIKGVEVRMRLQVAEFFDAKHLDTTFYHVYDTLMTIKGVTATVPYTGASTWDTVRSSYGNPNSNVNGRFLIALDTNRHIVESMNLDMKYSFHSGSPSSRGSRSSFHFSTGNIPYVNEGPNTIRINLFPDSFALSSDSARGGPVGFPSDTWSMRTDSTATARPNAYVRVTLK